METSLTILIIGYYMLLLAAVFLGLAATALFYRHKELEKLHKRVVKLLMMRSRKL